MAKMMRYYKTRMLLGFFLFSFILYNRLFRDRQEKLLYISFDLWKFSWYILISCTMILLCCRNILIFYLWLGNKTQLPEISKFRSRIKVIVCFFLTPVTYVRNNLKLFDAYVKNNIPYYDDEQTYADLITRNVGYYMEKHRGKTLIVTLVIIVFCQSIAVLSFFVDVVFLGKFFYFYKYLWLLIFPLIIEYVVYSVNTYSNSNLEALNNYIYIYLLDKDHSILANDFTTLPRITLEHHAIMEKAKIPEVSYIYSLSPQLLQEDPKIDVLATIERYKPIINTYCALKFYVADWEHDSKNYLSLFNILKYILYALSWLYMAYMILKI